MGLVIGGFTVNLINVLVVAIALLTVLSALTLVLGSSKQERGYSLWFLVAAIGELVWGASIAVMLSLPPTDAGYAVAPWMIKGIYMGAIVMDIGVLGYVAWRNKFGKVLTSLFMIFGLILMVIFLYDPSVLYTSINLSHSGNSISIDLSRGWYIIYIIYFITVALAFCLTMIYRILHTNNKNTRKGYLFFLIGLSISGGLAPIFDLFMPIWRYDLIWVGPTLIGLTMTGFYYAVLRYRMVTINTNWLKAMSSIVLVGGVLCIYLLIFHLVFAALFKVASPSFQVVLLNFIMVAVVLVLTPAIIEIWAMVKSLIMAKQIDLVYIVKKLSKINTREPNLRDISGFLAEHMHFTYVGFLINGKYFAADDYKIPVEEFVEIPKLDYPAKGIWQAASSLDKEMTKKFGIYRVGCLSGASGEMVGQVILGRPTMRGEIDKKDWVEIEMVMSLMGTIIENGGKRIKG